MSTKLEALEAQNLPSTGNWVPHNSAQLCQLAILFDHGCEVRLPAVAKRFGVSLRTVERWKVIVETFMPLEKVGDLGYTRYRRMRP